MSDRALEATLSPQPDQRPEIGEPTVATAGQLAVSLSLPAILRETVTCDPLADNELGVAMKYGREGAVPYLAAAIVSHCAGISGGLESYQRSTKARAEITRIKNYAPNSMSQVKKAAVIDRLEKELASLQPTTDHYVAILREVSEEMAVFERRYMPAGRPNHVELGKLHDQTDPLRHPAIIEAATQRQKYQGMSGTQTEARLAAMFGTERLIRSIVHRALNEQTPVQ